MNDDKDRREDDEAFWEDEGGDRTITSPFELPEGAPSPVSEPPEEEATKVGDQDPMVLRALAQPATAPVAFGVLGNLLPSTYPSSVPPPQPAASGAGEIPGFGVVSADIPSASEPPAAPHHVVVGSDAVGDEATVAVPAPSHGSKDIAAALAATLGVGSGWTPPEPPPFAPPSSQRSPVSSTFGGAPPSHGAHPFAPPSPGPIPALPHSPGPMPVQPPWSAASATGPAYPPYPYDPQAGPGTSPGRPAVPGPMPPMYAPQAPRQPTRGRSQMVLLVVVGVVCLTIFVVGVVLFLRTNF